MQEVINVNVRKADGRTLLMCVIDDNQSNMAEEVVRLLKDGADVNIEDKWGENALFHAVRSPAKDSFDVCKLLIDAGTNVNHLDMFCNRAIMVAAANAKDSEQLKKLQLLIDSGADVNVFNRDCDTPLVLATKYCTTKSSLDAIKCLLAGGASVNTSIRSTSALMKTIKPEYAEARELLLQSGADVNFRNYYGLSTIDIASLSNYTETVEHLLRYNSNQPMIVLNGRA